MKNIKIDLSTYIIFILFCLGGNFKKLLLIIIILFFHELGHIIMFKIYKVKIFNIKIYPFGGIIETNRLINFPLNKDLLIASIGIINQIILFFIFYILKEKYVINYYTYDIFIKSNTSLLIFNLLPIVPLDGSKIISSILNKYISFHKANNVVIVISLIMLILLIISSISYKINIIFITTFLIYKLIYYLKNKKYIENKFLLERTIYNLPYKKINYSKEFNKNNLKIDTLHYFNYKNEKNYLNKIYDI